MNKIKNNAGITLIELLISSIMSVIVIGAAMGVYIAQHKHMVIQDQVTDMQHNVRASMEELTSKIRMAGYNVPDGINPLVAYNTNPDTIVIIYDSDLAQDIDIDHNMPQLSAELRCDDDDLSALHDGDWVYIYDPATQQGEFFLISHVQYGSGHIQHNTMPLTRYYPVGSRIIRMNRYKYYVDYTSDPNHPKLMVQNIGDTPQIYADDITDLQFKYRLSSGALVDVPAMAQMVREVMIDVTARTQRADEAGNYGYRTRNLQTGVKVRNLGIN